MALWLVSLAACSGRVRTGPPPASQRVDPFLQKLGELGPGMQRGTVELQQGQAVLVLPGAGPLAPAVLDRLPAPPRGTACARPGAEQGISWVFSGPAGSAALELGDPPQYWALDAARGCLLRWPAFPAAGGGQELASLSASIPAEGEDGATARSDEADSDRMAESAPLELSPAPGKERLQLTGVKLAVLDAEGEAMAAADLECEAWKGASVEAHMRLLRTADGGLWMEVKQLSAQSTPEEGTGGGTTHRKTCLRRFQWDSAARELVERYVSLLTENSDNSAAGTTEEKLDEQERSWPVSGGDLMQETSDSDTHKSYALQTSEDVSCMVEETEVTRSTTWTLHPPDGKKRELLSLTSQKSDKTGNPRGCEKDVE